MGKPLKLGLVGIGKIARDQHLPAIAADPRFELVATASRHATLENIPGYGDIAEMIAADHRLDAVSLCTPPEGRSVIAGRAIAAGLHVMLEKPPAVNVTKCLALSRLAQKMGVTLFATWHSRAAAGVAAARRWLAERRVTAVTVVWAEDIRRWHPGQEWILGPGGFGVFDPGINALSILTEILPDDVVLETAQLDVPAGRASPIAAQLTMRTGRAPVTMTLDFLQNGPQSWDIAVATDAGELRLRNGGAVLELPGAEAQAGGDHEYASLYDRFADLIARRASDVDVRPLQIVADAFLVADRRVTEPFEF